MSINFTPKNRCMDSIAWAKQWPPCLSERSFFSSNIFLERFLFFSLKYNLNHWNFHKAFKKSSKIYWALRPSLAQSYPGPRPGQAMIWKKMAQHGTAHIQICAMSGHPRSRTARKIWHNYYTLSTVVININPNRWGKMGLVKYPN